MVLIFKLFIYVRNIYSFSFVFWEIVKWIEFYLLRKYLLIWKFVLLKLVSKKFNYLVSYVIFSKFYIVYLKEFYC